MTEIYAIHLLFLAVLVGTPSRAAPPIWDRCAGIFHRLFEANKKVVEQTSPPVVAVQPEPEPFKIIRQKTGQLTDRQISESESVIYDINDMLAGHLKIPQSIMLDMAKRDGGAFKARLSGDIGQIEAPYQIVKEGAGTKPKQFTKHPVYSRAIMAHEYGHAIFFETMRLRRESFAQAMNKWPNYWEFDLPRSREAVKLHDLMLPYNELFADLTAVLYTKDLSAIRKSLSFSGMSTKQKKRSFTKGFCRSKYERDPHTHDEKKNTGTPCSSRPHSYISRK